MESKSTTLKKVETITSKLNVLIATGGEVKRENIKEAELKLAELWKEQGSNFDLFALKNTDYYKNLYKPSAKDPTKLTSELNSMQDVLLRGLGFEGFTGTNAVNTFSQMIADAESLKTILKYIQEKLKKLKMKKQIPKTKNLKVLKIIWNQH